MKLGILTRAHIAAIVSITGGLPAVAQEEDLARALGGEEMFSLAVGYEQPLSEAPAVATVITAKDIEAIGAYRIEDVLATVTGLHISKNRAHDSIYVIRSITSEVNPHVLFMINGAPIGDAVQGGRPLGWTLPVQNISRIEVVRGPGSALYGADAFAGTVNIITKDASEIGDFSVGILGGSFGTYGGWLQGGMVRDNVEAALSFEVQTTDGDDPTLATDFQTFLDALMGTSASFAPGRLNLARTDVNVRGDVKIGDRLRWRAAYQGIINAENGVGVAYALDQAGQRNLHLVSSDITYDQPVAEDFDLSVGGSFFREDFKAYFQSNPPGSFGAFPEGVLNQIDFILSEYRAKAIGLYSGIASHTLQFGVGVTHQRASNIVDRRNFLQAPGGILVPAPGFLTTDELGVLPNAFADDRTNLYGLIQDEWILAPDWRLTLGVRADHFTNFGLTVNPRASLVWNATPTTTVKALYGRAFRPPTFLEETEGSGLIARGNRDLQPETVNTVEFVLQRDWTPRFSTETNAYAYWTDNLIEVVPSPTTGIPTFENGGATFGYGLEADANFRLSDALSLRGGYSFQKSEQRTSGAQVEGVPKHLLYGEARWSLSPKFSATFAAKYVGDRRRTTVVGQNEIDSYVLSDITMRYTPKRASRLFVQLSVDNLSNVDAREPRPNLIFEPEDIPLEGRRFIARVGVSY